MWAHSGSWKTGLWHPLPDHVRATASLARMFADPFDAGDLAAALGLMHDAGKVRCAWQDKLKVVAGTGARVGLPHKDLGAALLLDRAGPAALAVLGHHGGLTDMDNLKDLLRTPVDESDVERFFAVVPEARALIAGPPLLPEAWIEDLLLGEMGIRMVFSALVDADHLDTAAHFRELTGPLVAAPADMAELVRRFEHHRATMFADRRSEVDVIRATLYDEVIGHAPRPTGVYRLPGPTGSGKTITSAGFALHHAAHWGKSRVIVAVPFTTITAQNAMAYRDLLGDDVVLEHHSNMELDGRGLRLGAENWDAPFVVTTTVQLFDSLFGNKPARSRKLHRLANAVVVLDEVQAMPVSLLVPILDGLRLLSRHFGTTVVLASATQPAFEHLSAGKSLDIKELVAKPRVLFDRLRRVRFEWRVDPKPTMAEMAGEIATEPRALAIVNTVAHARTLYRLVAQRSGAQVWHLSTRMCPLHRRAVLNKVRELLNDGQPLLVVATQLIEAGVDVDFPAVYRAFAPAEALLQAAGRANREGKLPQLGKVVVFDAADAPVPRFYGAGVGKTRSFFGPHRAPDDPEALAAYYRSLYTGLNVEAGRRGVAIQDSRRRLDFTAVVRGPLINPGESDHRDSKLAFRMIDEDPVSVVVSSYANTGRVAELLDRVRASTGSLREVFRELRDYTVSIPRTVATDRAVQAMCRPVVDRNTDLWEWFGEYDDMVGIDEGQIGKETVW